MKLLKQFQQTKFKRPKNITRLSVGMNHFLAVQYYIHRCTMKFTQDKNIEEVEKKCETKPLFSPYILDRKLHRANLRANF